MSDTQPQPTTEESLSEKYLRITGEMRKGVRVPREDYVFTYEYYWSVKKRMRSGEHVPDDDFRAIKIADQRKNAAAGMRRRQNAGVAYVGYSMQSFDTNKH